MKRNSITNQYKKKNPTAYDVRILKGYRILQTKYIENSIPNGILEKVYSLF